MYTRKILSTATAVALITTGVMAFDTNGDGDILAEGAQIASYVGGVNAQSDLNISEDLRGDALIYPFYRHSDGWETEIVVRNTTENAIVAKAVVYSGDESDEVVDFNIYLSPRDVFRFTMKDDNLYTKDGSMPYKEISPRFALTDRSLKNDRAVMNPHWDDKKDDYTDHAYKDGKNGFPIIGEHGTDNILSTYRVDTKGYVVIYGLTEYPSEADGIQFPYHKKHLEMWKDYRRLLDDCRPGWRKSFTAGGMKNGAMTTTATVLAPNVAPNCGRNDGPSSPDDANIGAASSILASSGYDLAKFGDVGKSALVGTVRVYNAGNGSAEARELLLPATPVANFTDGNMLLWSDGEYANLADRRIAQSNSDTRSKYQEDDIQNDAMNAFGISEAFYTYHRTREGDDEHNGVLADNLIITQPLKKVLTQLEEASDKKHWTSSSNCHPRLAPSQRSTNGMGFYIYDVTVDEQENIGDIVITPDFEHFTSPYIPDLIAPEKAFCDELQVITRDLIPNIENITIADDEFSDGEGYVYMNFSQSPDTEQGERNGIPAIVTQMVGSKVNGVAQTNWIYAPTIKTSK